VVRRGPQVKLYVEGGGDSEATHTELRQAFSSLLRAAGAQRLPRIIACGSRRQTLDDFNNAVEQMRESERPFVLVDSESPVDEGASIWDHLRKEDRWVKPKAAASDSGFLMIQCMETWLVADAAAIEKYCGAGFNRKSLPQWPILEAVAKLTVQKALESATRRGKPYAKGQVSFEILGKVAPSKLEAACPEAKRFLDAMRAL